MKPEEFFSVQMSEALPKEHKRSGLWSSPGPVGGRGGQACLESEGFMEKWVRAGVFWQPTGRQETDSFPSARGQRAVLTSQPRPAPQRQADRGHILTSVTALESWPPDLLFYGAQWISSWLLWRVANHARDVLPGPKMSTSLLRTES